MAFGKGTIFMNGPHGTGASETYYHQDTGASVTDILHDLDSLARKRNDMLAEGYAIVWLRATIEDDLGVDQLGPGIDPASGKGPKSVNKIGTADAPWMCALARAQYGVRNHSERYLIGVPDEIIVAGEFTGDAEYNKRLANLLLDLNKSWGGKVKSKEADNPEKKIEALNVDNTGKVTITITGHGFQPGDRVDLHKVKMSGSAKVKGTHYIFVIDTNQFYLQDFSVAVGTVWKGGGTARKVKYIIKPFSNLFTLRPAHRKRGPGSLVYHGRSRGK